MPNCERLHEEQTDFLYIFNKSNSNVDMSAREILAEIRVCCMRYALFAPNAYPKNREVQVTMPYEASDATTRRVNKRKR